jgi:hypothetical protein
LFLVALFYCSIPLIVNWVRSFLLTERYKAITLKGEKSSAIELKKGQYKP